MKLKYVMNMIKSGILFSTLGIGATFNAEDDLTPISEIKSFEQKLIQINSDVIEYYTNKNHSTQGDKTIIINHGAFVTPEAMLNLAEELDRKGYQVVVPSVPAHGITGTPKTSIDEMTATMKEFAATLQEAGAIGSELYYYGWSMGGSIAMKLALENTLGIKGIILGNSSFKWETIPDIPADVFPYVFSNLFASELSVDLTDEEKQKIMNFFGGMCASVDASMADIKAAQQFNISDKMSQIGVSTLILSGENDHVAPIENQYAMQEAIPNSILKIIEDEGHCLPIDNPDLVAESIDEFIKSLKK